MTFYHDTTDNLVGRTDENRRKPNYSKAEVRERLESVKPKVYKKSVSAKVFKKDIAILKKNKCPKWIIDFLEDKYRTTI